MKSLLKRLKEVDSLPVLPETVRELQRILSEDSGDVNELVSLIEKDVSLSSTLLACANSALYNYSGRTITNLRDAIVRVGRNELYSILLTTALINVIPLDNNAIDYRSFWVQSLATASLLRKVKLDSSIEQVKASPILYTTGLFHDMGLLLYAICFQDRLHIIRKLRKENSWSFNQCEVHINSSETHASLGASLLEIWKIDTTISQLVRYHESPLQVAERLTPLTSILHICSRLVSSQLPNYDLFDDGEISPKIFHRAGLLEDDNKRYVSWAEEAIYRAYDTLSLWNTVSLRPVGSSQLFRPV